jgi:hypothetical protein
VDEACRQLLGTAMRQMHLSARAPGPNRCAGAGYHRIVKLARTIADLAGAERTPALHLRWCRCKCPAGAECVASPKGIPGAIQYRPRRVE